MMADATWCAWCGGPLPDHRLGHETCGGVCEAALAADRARAQAEWANSNVVIPITPDRKQLAALYQRQNRERRLERGVCVRCSKPNDTPDRKCCAACRAAAIARQRDRKAAMAGRPGGVR
jgi:hypothetical protein